LFGGDEIASGRRKHKEIKTVAVMALGLAVFVLCGYLLWLFHHIDFLPLWLNIMIRLLLLVMGASSLVVTVIQVKDIWYD